MMTPDSRAARRDRPVVTASSIEEAAERLAPVVRRTPLERSPRLSDVAGASVWLKREDLQTVRSYKIRGAYNLIVQLRDRSRGVVCASAGNHAQGVALACRGLGVRGRIYVPRTTPRQKRLRIATFGGDDVQIVVGGDTYDEAAAAATEDAQSTGATLVPAFDDPRTIAGQGSIAPEIVEQLGHAPDVVVVPVGGGGLLSGMVTWFQERYPQTRIVGVEPAGAASMMAALAAGEPVMLSEVEPFVDGAAVRRAGDTTFPLVRDSGVEVLQVDEGVVCTEMLDLYQSEGVIAEPAGALAPAALRGQVVVEPGADVIAVLSGGNNDVSRYGEVLDRSLISQGLKHYFLVSFPQEPGALRRFLDDVLGPNDDITLFDYVKRNNRESGPALIAIETQRPEDVDSLVERMTLSPLVYERIEPGSAMFEYLM